MQLSTMVFYIESQDCCSDSDAKTVNQTYSIVYSFIQQNVSIVYKHVTFIYLLI